MLFHRKPRVQKNGSEFKVSTLKGIRVANDKFSKQVPNNKPNWSIVGDSEFEEAKRSSSTISRP